MIFPENAFTALPLDFLDFGLPGKEWPQKSPFLTMVVDVSMFRRSNLATWQLHFACGMVGTRIWPMSANWDCK